MKIDPQKSAIIDDVEALPMKSKLTNDRVLIEIAGSSIEHCLFGRSRLILRSPSQSLTPPAPKFFWAGIGGGGGKLLAYVKFEHRILFNSEFLYEATEVRPATSESPRPEPFLLLARSLKRGGL